MQLKTGLSLLVVLVAGLGGARGHAASFFVNTTADPPLSSASTCSLRQAIQAVNTRVAVGACPAPNTWDIIYLSAGTYALTQAGAAEDANQTGDLDVLADVGILGAGPETTFIDGGGLDRVMHVFPGVEVDLYHVTLTNGAVPSGTPDGNGGGVLVEGTLTLGGCTVSANAAGGSTDTPGHGGGVYVAAGGSLTVSGGEITGNRAGASSAAGGGGGGVYAAGSATLYGVLIASNATGGPSGRGGGIASRAQLTVTRCTFTGNVADHAGGAIWLWGTGPTVLQGSLFELNSALYYGGAVYIGRDDVETTNCTMVSNSAGAGGAIMAAFRQTLSHSTLVANRGGGLDGMGPLILGIGYVRSSIVAGNRDASDSYYEDCSFGVSFAFSGYGNVFGWGSGCQSTGSVFVDPSLVATEVVDPTPAHHGGPTRTCTLRPRSPAIDAGACTDVHNRPVETDQRGYPRPVGAGCDAGAFESGPVGALTRASDEPPGEHCASGGLKIEIGLDTDQDLLLDDLEVASTFYVCNGEPGATGSGGHSTLVAATNEPPGDNCAEGGIKIETWLDTNDNGVLDGTETPTVEYVCNPPAPAGTLVATAEEPVGENCPAGGTKVEAGLDVDGDGFLAPEEVTSRAFVCAGAQGPDGASGVDGRSALVAVTDEPPGSNCPAGGTRIEAGIDANGSGRLEPEEVTGTSFWCQPIAASGAGGCAVAGPRRGAAGPAALVLAGLSWWRWRRGPRGSNRRGERASRL